MAPYAAPQSLHNVYIHLFMPRLPVCVNVPVDAQGRQLQDVMTASKANLTWLEADRRQNRRARHDTC